MEILVESELVAVLLMKGSIVLVDFQLTTWRYVLEQGSATCGSRATCGSLDVKLRLFSSILE
jgi:hypothetical protein